MRTDYLKQVQATVDYIDTHLAEELSLSLLAKVALLSDYHFHRVFQTLAGETVMEYVRKRRLARSAYQVSQTEERLLDIALANGFQNHETFTRAFKRMFELTPAEYRKRGIRIPAYAKLNVLQRKYNPYLGGIQMDYRMETKPAFKVIGYEIQTTSDGENLKQIPAFWQTYIQNGLGCKIPNRVHQDSPIELGVCHGFNMDEGTFLYLIGMEAESFDNVPADMVCREFGEAEYAVFTTPKVPEDQFSPSIQSTWQAIFSEWFPHSGYEHTGKPEFELYDYRSGPGNELWQMDIYVPVKRKDQ
ncbi:AraC family transcriptional regulator [Paenibacillus sacheonensis]|uniref:Helix-turn-helix domain-containing protein n=1 Tax=Paenibacillus sacheonensis TaxID=742054 RepID=A0A7X5C0U8_9BACL|nr:effector binding domain-containing protein [Paenibacillus sacheonensis]MBM7568393.1 AraC family transcriptional regulator [Paenibacillus sacheonensis]NBC72092.1 helix-turn-helix domain-containing protein [Paenibacillus sacheonensis]